MPHTAFTTSHIPGRIRLGIPDAKHNVEALEEIARVIGTPPCAPFLLINGCSDKNSARFEDDLRIYAAFARRNGAPADVVQGAVQMQRESLYYVLPEREVALMAETGFGDVRLFYTGLRVFGWIANPRSAHGLPLAKTPLERCRRSVK